MSCIYTLENRLLFLMCTCTVSKKIKLLFNYFLFSNAIHIFIRNLVATPNVYVDHVGEKKNNKIISLLLPDELCIQHQKWGPSITTRMDKPRELLGSIMKWIGKSSINQLDARSVQKKHNKQYL